jgi:tetratricopeptide (TPR) repeat protein
MSKKIAVFIFSILFFVACDKTAQQAPTADASASNRTNDSQIVSGHSQAENSNFAGQQNSAALVPKSETKTKWTQSGTPIDVSEFNEEIARAEKNLKAKPKDAQARKTAAEAFLKRAIVLTDARQYASALGDYRRVLKYDAENEDAKKWISQIIEIYEGLNKEAPPAGEEPPPLPFEKKT